MISLAKDRHLCVLAAQAQNRGARNVGMMNVTRDQAAEIIGIFARAAAAAFVHQEFDAINIFEYAWRLGARDPRPKLQLAFNFIGAASSR